MTFTQDKIKEFEAELARLDAERADIEAGLAVLRAIEDPPVKMEKVTDEAVRTWAVKERAFFVSDMALHFGRTKQWARVKAKSLVARGLFAENKEGARLIYRYVPPMPTGTPHRPPPKGSQKVRQGVASSGRGQRSGNAEVNRLLKQVRDLGFSTPRGGRHYSVRDSVGRVKGSIPANPKDTRTLDNVRAELKRNGVAL